MIGIVIPAPNNVRVRRVKYNRLFTPKVLQKSYHVSLEEKNVIATDKTTYILKEFCVILFGEIG